MGYIPTNTSTPNDGLGDALRTFALNADTMFAELYASVVFKEAGKGLSSNDFTSAEKTKLAGVATGAEVNVQADLAQDDDTQDNFIKNRDSVLPGRTPPQVVIYAGVSTFTIPVGKTVSQVLLVRTILWEIDEWTQSGNILTITKTMNTGNRIQINFY